MSLLKKALGALLGLLVVAFGVGFALPSDVHVERAITIDAPSEQVFAQISDLKAWDAWSPWAKIDPNAQMTVTGAGVGQTMVWSSENPQVGNGSQEVTALEAPNLLKTHLAFDDQGVADATFNLTSDDEGATQVTWSLDSSMGEDMPVYMQPVNAYMSLFMNVMLGKDYETGLQNLKEVVEG